MAYDDNGPQHSSGSNELILNPGEFAFMQDKTKGTVQTVVGPFVVTQSGQLRPIKYADGAFRETSLEGAVQQSVSANKGEYLILHNPTSEDAGLRHPQPNNNNAVVPELLYGEKIVVPGPCQFSLWPEQQAKVVRGHNLRDDQFLVVRVYDEKAAINNWSDAVVNATDNDADTLATQDAAELNLKLGKLLVIKNVSFYIPCTGIEVVQNGDNKFIRDALTLEMSEYAILVDQSGNKRYERGPQIVFPAPTEEFFSEGGNIKFRPIELTPTQGLHIKINCDYTDKAWPSAKGIGEHRFCEGDEIFVTGGTHPIYYPCEEHSIIRYGDNLVHFATAVSAGQARYVMDKNTGKIVTRTGPDMILLDPIDEVFVTRVLSDAESSLMYPGNSDSLDYNRQLRDLKTSKGMAATEALKISASMQLSDSSTVRSFAAPAALPDQIRRKTQYTKPHSVTLNENRFSGAPTLKIWTGFAVLLTKADGSRRVEVGPQVVVLDYDETAASLHLSTGKPKTTDRLLTTGYLEVANNKVSDVIEVETEDGVCVRIKVSYRVSFTGSPEKWFNVDNYVKFLCDHARSRLKGAARRYSIRDFYGDTVDIVRDTILGEKNGDSPREGLVFDENGMQVTDVELLDIEIVDGQISTLLAQQQKEVITSNIEIDRAQQTLQVAAAQQEVELEKLKLVSMVREAEHGIRLSELTEHETVADFKATEALKRADEENVLVDKAQEGENAAHQASMVRMGDRAELDMAMDKAKTEDVVARFKAAEGDLAAAIRELGDEQVIVKVAEALGPMGLIGGIDLSTVVRGLIGSGGQKSELFDRLSGLAGGSSDV